MRVVSMTMPYDEPTEGERFDEGKTSAGGLLVDGRRGKTR